MQPIEIQFFSVFIIVAIIVVFIIFTVIKQWHKNNRSPKIVINSTVLEKRKQRVSHSSAGAAGSHVVYGAEYWITFQLEGGDSVEFWLKENEDEYNRLKIGDCGKLTFQGTRYLGFEKKKSKIN